AGDVVLYPEVEAEDRQVGDGGDAVGAVGEVRSGGAVGVVGRDAEDVIEAEGDDGQVVGAQSQCRGADAHAEDERGDGCDDHGRPEGELDVERRVGGAGDECGGVGTDAEEGDVPEVEQTGQADHDVEPQGDGGEDQNVDAE